MNTEDQTFLRFRTELADAVTVATLSGRFGPGSCRCPLGCHPKAGAVMPSPELAAQWWCISEENAREFIEGYDQGLYTGRLERPYANLGSLYRARVWGWMRL